MEPGESVQDVEEDLLLAGKRHVPQFHQPRHYFAEVLLDGDGSQYREVGDVDTTSPLRTNR